MSGDPVADQIAVWKQALQEGQSLAPVEIAKRLMGDKFVMAVPMRLGGTGFYPVIRIVPISGCDVSKYSWQLREELDKIGWQFVTILNDDQPTAAQRRFAMAPITNRSVTVVYHTTRASTLEIIQREGLLPSNPARRLTDYPDTDGKLHVCEALTGDGSASRWVRIFSQRYNRRPEEYAILRVDLTGLGARVYLDVRSQYGLIVDRFERIPPERVSLERLGLEEDLA
jgi:hypothetical protein